MSKGTSESIPLPFPDSEKPLKDMDDDEFFDHIENHDTADYWDEFEDVEDVTIERP